MPSPTRANQHSIPHGQLGAWLGVYATQTPGVECADNATIRLDLDNEPQPDLVLMKLTETGGQARVTDDYIEGPPELVAEIVGSSAACDLHQKKGVYRRNGICVVVQINPESTRCRHGQASGSCPRWRFRIARG